MSLETKMLKFCTEKVEQATPYPDEPSMMIDPGWYVIAWADDNDESPEFVLKVDSGADEDVAKFVATQLGRQHETIEGILETPENPVDEPATARRDDGIRIYIKDVVEVLAPAPPAQSSQDAPISSSLVSMDTGTPKQDDSGQLRLLIEDGGGVGSVSETIALALADAYTGIEFEDPTFERGTIAIMTALRERAVQASASQSVHPDWLTDDDHAAERAAHADNWEEQ